MNGHKLTHNFREKYTVKNFRQYERPLFLSTIYRSNCLRYYDFLIWYEWPGWVKTVHFRVTVHFTDFHPFELGILILLIRAP